MSNCQWTNGLTAVCRIWCTLVLRAILQIRPRTEIRLHFGWSRIWAGFVKMAGFRPETEPKSGTALATSTRKSELIGEAAHRSRCCTSTTGENNALRMVLVAESLNYSGNNMNQQILNALTLVHVEDIC